MRAAGIVLVAAGGGGIIAGASLLLISAAEHDLGARGEGWHLPAGIAFLVFGVASTGVGIPLWVVGGRRVRDPDLLPLAPEVSLSPTGGSLTWRF